MSVNQEQDGETPVRDAKTTLREAITIEQPYQMQCNRMLFIIVVLEWY